MSFEMIHDFKQFLHDVYDTNDPIPSQILLHIVDIVSKMCQAKKQEILYQHIVNKIANTVAQNTHRNYNLISKNNVLITEKTEKTEKTGKNKEFDKIVENTNLVKRVVHKIYKEWLSKNVGNKITVYCDVVCPKTEFEIDIVSIEKLPEKMWYFLKK